MAPNIYRLQASNPGQFYYNVLYQGTTGAIVTLEIQIPYPFVTQEGGGVPIQVHDWLSLYGINNCLSPMLDGYDISTLNDDVLSNSGNPIITWEDYATKNMRAFTTVAVSGAVPDTGILCVTIHLDYGLKKTGSWKPTGTTTTNTVSGPTIKDVMNQAGFGSGSVTIHGYELYEFSWKDGTNEYTSTPSSINEFKKFAGFMDFVIAIPSDGGDPIEGAAIEIYDPSAI